MDWKKGSAEHFGGVGEKMPCLTSEIMLMIENENLDEEWTELILTALEIGISSEEIRAYFKEHNTK